jgi:hypothetical protein
MATSFETGAYNPADIQITLGGIPVSGFGEGAFISVKFDKPAAEVQQGADGYVAVLSKPAGRTATATLRLQQTSMANATLYAALAKQQASGGFGLPAFQILNSRSQEVAIFPQAVILDTATLEYGDALSEREWMLQGRCEAVFTGSPVP